MKTDKEKTEYRALKTQTLFDDVDKIVQHLQIRIGTIPDHQEDRLLIIESQLTLAKAVQILRPSTLTPTECSLELGLERQLETLTEELIEDTLSHQECDLIQYMRTEGLSAGKLTTYLTSWVLDLSPQVSVQCLREET